MTPYERAQMQLRQCLVAAKNRMDMGFSDPNFPDTDRLTLSRSDFDRLATYFRGLQSDYEFSTLYPDGSYRFEVASSGSTGGVWDLKISPIVFGASGPTIFNYHIGVQG
ncbi:hypothetical protein HPC49_29685 [Pyxidicoccus fallax]|uniref:Uncharacterized protein n=1 Tax=Pyxidicoccus fallax TaxID=394095 RepID=A0A848LUM2_9BACT|nr:hypothetical protein [Pyxidicoccus fallax]NMO21292.1 hypothetical protein [Pyxidicoccus fallax]NPC82380.1 hypothetical protein [Pyxidicoccus fallax]